MAQTAALGQIPLQPAQGLRQVFHGIGVGEAQKTLASRTEIDARGDPDLDLFQNIKGQGVGVGTGGGH